MAYAIDKLQTRYNIDYPVNGESAQQDMRELTYVVVSNLGARECNAELVEVGRITAAFERGDESVLRRHAL